MSTLEKSLLVATGIVAVLAICCVGAILGASVANNRERSRPVAAAIPRGAGEDVPPTAVPTLAAPNLADISANAANLTALTAYAEEIRPLLEEGLAAAERDGQILEAGKNDPAALCGGSQTAHPTFVADAAMMARLKSTLQQVAAPAEVAVQVHQPLLDSFALWGEALSNLNKSCATNNTVERDLLRLGASLQLGGALLNFHVASDNFWRLMVVYGLEAIAGPRP